MINNKDCRVGHLTRPTQNCPHQKLNDKEKVATKTGEVCKGGDGVDWGYKKGDRGREEEKEGGEEGNVTMAGQPADEH